MQPDEMGAEAFGQTGGQSNASGRRGRGINGDQNVFETHWSPSLRYRDVRLRQISTE